MPVSGPTEKDGSGLSGRLGYQQGPLWVAVAAGKTRYNAGDITQSNIGASYDLSVVKLIGQYVSDKNRNGNVRGKGYLLGVTAPVFAVGQLRASYQQEAGPGLRAQPEQAHGGVRHAGPGPQQRRRHALAVRLDHGGQPEVHCLRSGPAPQLLILRLAAQRPVLRPAFFHCACRTRRTRPTNWRPASHGRPPGSRR